MNVNIGISELHEAVEMRVQSLVDEQLHVSYTSDRPLDAVILSANGQMLRSERLAASPVPSTRQLDMRGLSPGLYVLDLRSADGSHMSARFVKP